jgi:hypothetical protein
MEPGVVMTLGPSSIGCSVGVDVVHELAEAAGASGDSVAGLQAGAAFPLLSTKENSFTRDKK